jgi:hypothetical protein
MTPDAINQMLSNINEPSEKLKLLQSKKNDISTDVYNKIQAEIMEQTKQQRSNRYGWSMSPEDVSAHMKDFEAMDRDTRFKYYQDYNLHQNEKRVSKQMTSAEQSEYDKLNKIMAKKFGELQKDNRSEEDKKQEQSRLESALQTMQETSISSNAGIQSIVKQSEEVQKGVIKNFGDQINFMAQQNASISNMLAITARTIQKPNIYELDKTVISMIPELRGA